MNPLADIRGLLQYVPQFLGKTFVLDVDWTSQNDAVKAELLMDLTALQSVGVKLVLSMSESQAADFYHHSTELEFRVSAAVKTLDEDVAEVLERGQAVVLRREGEVLSEKLIALSVALGAAKLILLGPDVSEKDAAGRIMKFIHSAELKASDSSVLLLRAGKACAAGVPRVHLIDIQQQGVLINELFSVEGVGTMIYADSYRGIRALREEDIPEMLAMIGRSVRNTHLVPRTYEEVKAILSSYYVMEVDDNVVGCGALYRYEDCAEIACLYVKQSHESSGYGVDMVEFLEQQAKEAGVKKVFALSNRAADFFQNKLHYTESDVDVLPAVRRERLLSSGRESQVFVKSL